MNDDHRVDDHLSEDALHPSDTPEQTEPTQPEEMQISPEDEVAAAPEPPAEEVRLDAPVEPDSVPESEQEPKHELEPSAPEHTEAPRKRALLGRLFARRRTVVLAAVAAVLLLGSGGAWAVHYYRTSVRAVEHFTAAPAAFWILSTTPDDNAAGVVDASKIVINFNQPVDPSKLTGDFFVSPLVDGTFSQGTSSNQVIFTPVQPFANGISVKVMIHGEFQSKQGTKLGADYSFGFTTATPDKGVVFVRGNFYEKLGNVVAGQAQDYTVLVGQQLPSTTVTVYLSSTQQLLSSLVYNSKTTDGFTSLEFEHTAVDVAGLNAVTTKSGLKNNDHFSFTPTNAVYLLVATDNTGHQAGYTWLVASKFGVIVRQDDRQAILAAQDYASGNAVTANVTLYHLENSVTQLAQATITGSGAVQLPYKPSLDVAVARNGDDTAIVPVSTPLTLADIRVQKDLSTSAAVYGLTDRPTYGIGSVVHYAGFVRTDNDAAYQIPANSMMHLYVAARSDGSHYADATVPVSDAGVISTDFMIGAGAIPAGETSQELFVYNGSATNSMDAGSPIGAFTVTNTKASTDVVKVVFAKSSYLASDTITATVTGTDNTGAPLAGKTLTANIYSKMYYENDPQDNLSSFGGIGDKVTDTPLSLTLDASGHATIPIDVSKFSAGSSHVATVQASVDDPSGMTAGGGASVIVHEANGVLSFGPSRSQVHAGGQVVARVYARDLKDDALANATVAYTLSAMKGDNAQQLANGTVTTDDNGFAQIAQTVDTIDGVNNFKLEITTTDAQNNKITATDYYYPASSGNTVAYSDVQLSDLDISGPSTKPTVGQTLNLTINAPKATHALLTVERGRVHSYKMVDLTAGNNSYSLPVTDDMAPSFSLVLSYFRDGSYYTEGVTYDVVPTSKRADMQLSVPATISAGQPTTVNLTVKDTSGQPVHSPVVFAAVSADVYNLNDQVTPDIFGYLYSARDITTNASSSLLGIGSGGGKCGGGGFGQPALLNPLGTTLAWDPTLSTDASGSASKQLQLPKGTWRIYAYSANSDTVVGSTFTMVTVQ